MSQRARGANVSHATCLGRFVCVALGIARLEENQKYPSPFAFLTGFHSSFFFARDKHISRNYFSTVLIGYRASYCNDRFYFLGL